MRRSLGFSIGISESSELSSVSETGIGFSMDALVEMVVVDVVDEEDELDFVDEVGFFGEAADKMGEEDVVDTVDGTIGS